MLRRATILVLVFSFPTFTSAAQRTPVPKNVVILIADGSGFEHVKAAGFWRFGRPGCEAYESFPVRLSVSTDTKDGRVTDSAAAATALSTGENTCRGRLGVDCAGRRLMHLIERARRAGKAAGTVTTVFFDHATPAGFVVHSKDRDSCAGISGEMLYESGLEVIMGCGGDPYAGKSAGRAVVRTVGGFRELAASSAPPARVLGFPFCVETLQQKRRGNQHAAPFLVPLDTGVPDLALMVRGALNVLSRDPDGFFLMAEGGAIDWASHDNQTGRMIEEQTDFNRAVEAVITWVEENSSWEETLVIVTADHETGSLSGVRGNGRGRTPRVKWGSREHSRAAVPFFAKGAACDIFRAPLDNAGIGTLLGGLFEEQNPPKAETGS